MHYYQLKDKYLFSLEEYPSLSPIEEDVLASTEGIIYFLKRMPVTSSRRNFCLSDASLLFSSSEGLDLLIQDTSNEAKLPSWLLDKISERRVSVINTEYTDWYSLLEAKPPTKWRLNLAGLGDVGGTLLVGLRLLGGDCIDKIGIYDRDLHKLQRWEYEINQISDFQQSSQPRVKPIEYNEIFDCDMFIFCIAARVPAIGEEDVDVRMIQFNENAKIISEYAAMAKSSGFKGIFAVVSDPVDLLCKAVFNASQLPPEQIRGYGLGVMNARALYYAEKLPELRHYAMEGRAYGPHGEDLVIADSVSNYHQEKSLYLTEKARTANLEVRKAGFKPYIAPALSSGALSILSTLRGEWHYSATFMGGVYMGSKNRLSPAGTEVESLVLPPPLVERLTYTYNRLRSLL